MAENKIMANDVHTENALDSINEVRCMLLNGARSRRAYDKMTSKAEYAVCELQRALGIPANDDDSADRGQG